MKILLFGCSGFIGKELIPRLIAEKYDICIVSRRNIDQLQIRNSLTKINFLKLDATNEKNWLNENLIKNLKDSDGIINLIGEPIADKRWTDSQKKEIEDSRINTTKYLMKNLKSLKINPKFIINASAIGYYGTSLSNEFTEDSDNGEDFLAKLCKDWEQEALKKKKGLGQAASSASHRLSKECWLAKGIVVKIMSKELKSSGFYKEKASVKRVLEQGGRHIGEVEHLKTGALIQVDQEQLETVIPKEGGRVLVLSGAHKGAKAKLLGVNTKKFQAEIEIEDAGRRRLWVEYDDVSKVSK